MVEVNSFHYFSTKRKGTFFGRITDINEDILTIQTTRNGSVKINKNEILNTLG